MTAQILPLQRSDTTPLPAVALHTLNLSLHYHGQLALAPISLAMPQRSVTALIGPSGCGKTSFLQCLNRLVDLIPGALVSGEVRIDGEDIYQPATDLTHLRRRVGMIFQKPNVFPLSIRRNLELPLKELGMRDAGQRAAHIEQVLRDVGLWSEVHQRLDRAATALSGGQQQRLCIARALTMNPEILLMDEPCSALDPVSSGRVEELIAELRQRYSLVVVTHNMAQARRIADQVGVFWNTNGSGCLLEHGDSEQIFGAPREAITAAYINGRCC